MRRVFGIVSALAVSFFAILPVSAWDRYSFVDSDKYYSYVPVMQSASASDSSSGSSSGSLSGNDMFENLSLSAGVLLSVSSEYLPSVSLLGAYPQTPVSLSRHSGFGTPTYSGVLTVPSTASSYDVDAVGGLVFAPYDYGFSVDAVNFPPDFVDVPIDISSLGSFSSFDMSGGLVVSARIGSSEWGSATLQTYFVQSVDVLVNGVSEYSLSFPSDDANLVFPYYLYVGKEPVASLVLRFHFDIFSGKMISYSSVPSPLTLLVGFNNSSFTITSLSGSAINDAVNEEGQDAIDQEDALQSEWGGSMVENFNDLNIGSFTYPSGLTSAFSLVSGIFQDIWYAFDDYAVLWVFPLTLAILLLVVGRLSKFAGRSSKDGGDG